MQIYFFIGKGGTGKTTVSSAFAWQLSQIKKKTQLISIDPAHNLSDIFNIETKDNRTSINKYLDIYEPDFSKIKNDYIEQKKNTLQEITSHLSSFNLQKYFNTIKSSPGQEEYAIVLLLKRLLLQNNHDDQILVFDPPPTGLLLKILSLPTLSLEWLDNLINLRKKIVDRREMIGNIRASDKADKYYKDDDILQKLLSQKEDYLQLKHFFQNIAKIYLVINNNELVLQESKRIKDNINELEIELSGLVDNKSENKTNYKLFDVDKQDIIQIPKQTKHLHEQYKLSVNLTSKI